MLPLAVNVEATSNEVKRTKISITVRVIVGDGTISENFRAERFSLKGLIYFFFTSFKDHHRDLFFSVMAFFFDFNKNYLFNIYETMEEYLLRIHYIK